MCLYLEAGGCLHFQRSNLAKHLKMISLIFYIETNGQRETQIKNNICLCVKVDLESDVLCQLVYFIHIHIWNSYMGFS